MAKNQFGRLALNTADQKESARLSVLDSLDILDTPADETIDRITRLIQNIFGTDMAIVSMIDSHRQWYKSAQGAWAKEVPRRQSFCNHTIEGTSPLVVRDASQDMRFADHPNVVGDPHIRFYACSRTRLFAFLTEGFAANHFF